MLRNILTLSALIAAVLLVRAVFRNRMPKRLIYALWLVVLLKLCLPGTLVALPVLPAQETAAPVARAELPVQATAPTQQQPAQAVTQPQESVQQPVSPAQESLAPAAKPLTATQILQIVWLGGSVLLGLWLSGSWLVFTLRLQKSRCFLGKRGRTRIYVSDAVSSPCLAGLLPAVYLTQDVLQTEEAELILRHELTHLHHLDFLWSFCRAVAVAVYWWNPLVWLAAICSKRDAELACDEAVAAGLDQAQRLAYARAILAQAPRKMAALSLAGPPVKERILFLTKKRRTSAVCVVLALLLVVSATGCSFAELTRRKSSKITLPVETEPTQQETQKTATPLTQEQLDAVNAVFADYALSTDETLGHFAVNGFFTSTYDDVRDLNLNNFLAYFGECGEEDISEEEFAQLNAKWEFRVESVSDFPLPIHRYPASAVEGVLRRFAGIGLADLTDMQEPFSGYTYLEDTDAFYNTTSDYSPGYFSCTSGEIGPDGEEALLYGRTVGRLSGEAILKLVKDGESWYIHSFTLAAPDTGLVHRSGAEADFSQPLQAWELTNACGVQTGMTQAEVEDLVGTLSPGDTGNRLYDEQRLSYRFWDRSGGEPKLMEMEWNAAVENDEIIFETAQDAPSFRGICLGDTIDTVLKKFPCADRELKKQQSQTLYGQEGDADYASLHLIADSYYSLSFYIDGQWRASIDFSRVQQRAFRIVIYGNGYWQPGE